MPAPLPPRTNVRVGVVGVGQRGGAYAGELLAGRVSGATLAAVCDSDARALVPFPEALRFRSAAAVLDSRALDAVVIATPPAEHVKDVLAALELRLAVLVEKPLSPRKLACDRVIERHAALGAGAPVFATALPLRGDPRFVALRGLLASGELGPLRRIAWTITDCFRSDAYYRERAWRGHFSGEGGGLLLNQCLHQLDLWQWLFGMPRRVQAFCEFGAAHAIEVEDRVSAFFEHPRGLSGVFCASSGEVPGTNRLEVVGDRGSAVLEGERLALRVSSVSASESIRTFAVRDRAPAFRFEERVLEPARVGPRELLQNFVDAIGARSAVFASARDGVPAVELADALLLSGLETRVVELPLDARLFDEALERQIKARKNLLGS